MQPLQARAIRRETNSLRFSSISSRLQAIAVSGILKLPVLRS